MVSIKVVLSLDAATPQKVAQMYKKTAGNLCPDCFLL